VCYNVFGKNMAKFDGVIEAVRYKGGKIELVRAYERRGPTFSDRVLIDRPTLVASLVKGRRFVTGQRTLLLASTFEVGKLVILAGHNGEQVVTTLDQGKRDALEGVPVF
jgi:hypothetical protein